jgi:hypothetical protein
MGRIAGCGLNRLREQRVFVSKHRGPKSWTLFSCQPKHPDSHDMRRSRELNHGLDGSCFPVKSGGSAEK